MADIWRKNHADILMDEVLRLLANSRLPQSPAPHLEPDDDDEAYEILWRELGKAKDATDD